MEHLGHSLLSKKTPVERREKNTKPSLSSSIIGHDLREEFQTPNNKKKHQVSFEQKTPSCLGDIGDEKLPSCMGV